MKRKEEEMTEMVASTPTTRLRAFDPLGICIWIAPSRVYRERRGAEGEGEGEERRKLGEERSPRRRRKNDEERRGDACVDPYHEIGRIRFCRNLHLDLA